jgi:hypothetical protein
VSLLLLLAALPALYWPEAIDTSSVLRDAGITQILVPPEAVQAWRQAGLSATAMSTAELGAREALPAPGIQGQVALASATRAPFIVASGWRFLRQPGGKYAYDAPAGRAALAAAEAFAYDADVVLKIQPSDLGDLGRMLAFLAEVPPSDLPTVADIAVVEDGSPLVGEVMNLLARRNLLFRPAAKASQGAALTVKLGSVDFPRQDAADPSAFAQKVRRALGDERRSLRLYGSEVVIGRLRRDGSRARLDLVNYGGRDVVGLRVRVRGSFTVTEAFAPGHERVAVEDAVVTDEATEFTLARMGAYAAVLLGAAK